MSPPSFVSLAFSPAAPDVPASYIAPNASLEEILAWMDETAVRGYLMSDMARLRGVAAAKLENGEAGAGGEGWGQGEWLRRDRIDEYLRA